MTETLHVGEPPISYQVERFGDGPTVVMVHATGFCKEVWAPVAAEAATAGAGFTAVMMDQRAHGESGAPPPPFDWWDLGRDVLTVLDAVQSGPVVGLGHSSGAASLVMAELTSPGGFDSLVLIEPIILPPPFRRAEHRLAQMARKRRASFGSRAEALRNFSTKSPFAAWDHRALDAYVEGGLKKTSEGGYVLRCSPDNEAEFYVGATAHGAWRRLDELDLPLLVVTGELSDTHQPPFLDELLARLPRAQLVIVDDATHLVPMERPDVVGVLLHEILSEVTR